MVEAPGAAKLMVDRLVVLPDLMWLRRTRLQRMQTGTDSTPLKEKLIRSCPHRL
jgi:hypothetical protein